MDRMFIVEHCFESAKMLNTRFKYTFELPRFFGRSLFTVTAPEVNFIHHMPANQPCKRRQNASRNMHYDLIAPRDISLGR